MVRTPPLHCNDLYSLIVELAATSDEPAFHSIPVRSMSYCVFAVASALSVAGNAYQTDRNRARSETEWDFDVAVKPMRRLVNLQSISKRFIRDGRNHRRYRILPYVNPVD